VRDFFCFLPLQSPGSSEEEDEAVSEIERAVRKILIKKKVLESTQIVQVIGEEPKWPLERTGLRFSKCRGVWGPVLNMNCRGPTIELCR
jgi:hypothetical protein